VSLSPALLNAIGNTVRESGDSSPIVRTVPVGGGDINLAAQVITEQQAYFVKWHHSPPADFFECEADGLARLANAACIRVPRVIGLGQIAEGDTAYLAMEWIAPGGKGEHSAEELGQRLAQQHRAKQAQYGLAQDNFIGRLPQPNTPTPSWLEFYRVCRLGAQRDLARQHGLLPPQRARLLDQLLDTLDRWISDDCQPSLLHGDLWGGNWMAAADGEPVVIDPAVYVGCREVDLAMTTLFGGFPRIFYDAYNETFPLEAGYQERQPLYQLYYLLCHLNLFGEGYGGSVDSILRQYS
jgi:fructosamine-3-kinase